MPWDTYCRTYAPPDHFNGIDDDNVRQHVVSKICRINELKIVIMEQCNTLQPQTNSATVPHNWCLLLL